MAFASKAAKNHFDQCIALNRVGLTVPSICGMIVPRLVVPHIRAEPEPRCARGVVLPVWPQVDVFPKVDPPQNRKKRRDNSLEGRPPQDFKHKGIIHLVNPKSADPFGNLSGANPDFVCQGREYEKDANGAWIKNGMNYFHRQGCPQSSS